ncbi:MAG TPA: cadherin-like domain-containing protein, partial [Saprospiraceae bacterium]|nr:cadherin-like domain-containing protein [Saprospiraceae bacterium]
MTYCWEELDAGPEVPLGEPSGNAAIFRTFPADTFTYRYFPRLLNIINNTSSLTEQLPTYSRDLTFRLTARDNRPNGGGVGWADVEFKATDKAGPFKVLSPNTSTTTWRVGEYVNVQWDVANTEKAPVNCELVNIRLSTDAGKTYPILLAEKVPNDGSHYVKVPATLSLTARVRIDAVDNIFFDISNSNFRILNPTTPAFSMGLSRDAAVICQPDVFNSEVQTAGVLGYSTPVLLSVDRGNLPASAVVSLGNTQITPGDAVALSVDLNSGAQAGTYSFQVKAVATGGTDTLVRPISLTYYTNDFSAMGLKAPADGSQGQVLGQVLRWSLADDALAYDVQISTSADFAAGTIIASKSDVTVDSFKVPILLEKSTAYYWRVRPKNVCGTFAWTDPAFFATYVENCAVFGANDLPKLISASGTPTVESKITVNAGGPIKSLNVRKVKGSHTFFKDLDARLISPQGTEVILFKNRCGGLSISFDFRLDDNALAPFSCPPGNLGLLYRPESPLSALKGQNSTGTWILRVKDTQSSSGGNLDDFQLEFCADVTLNPPFLVNNNPLSIISGTNASIGADLLRADDPNNSHAQLHFTLLSVPAHGELQLNGSALQIGATFTQADIDGGALRFYDWGGSSAEDGFRFVVSDKEGGFVATPKFRILPTSVSAFEPRTPTLDFGLAPNPASQSAWLTLSAPAEADARVRLLNATGQVLQSSILPRGTERLQLTLAGLPQGIYWVQVESADATGVKKLVVR